jgi:hypothetical protein
MNRITTPLGTISPIVADIRHRAGAARLSSFRVYLDRLDAGYVSALDLNLEKFPSPKAKVTK